MSEEIFQRGDQTEEQGLEAQGAGLRVARIAQRLCHGCAGGFRKAWGTSGQTASQPAPPRSKAKAGELSVCLLRRKAFRKPPPRRRLSEGLGHQRTDSQPAPPRSKAKAGELSVCLRRRKAFRKPPPRRRLSEGLGHQRTDSQLVHQGLGHAECGDSPSSRQPVPPVTSGIIVWSRLRPVFLGFLVPSLENLFKAQRLNLARSEQGLASSHASLSLGPPLGLLISPASLIRPVDRPETLTGIETTNQDQIWYSFTILKNAMFLKKYAKHTLPVLYKWNSKTWLRIHLFTMWFTEYFNLTVETYLLRKSDSFQNIICLPNWGFSLFEHHPVHQKFVDLIPSYYLRNTFYKAIAAIESDSSGGSGQSQLKTFWKGFTMLHAIKNIYDSWQEVKIFT
ncbi:hypothetical protein QTO34_016869 [Cnephaeus nilssonii]|uniref:DDE-1 domain-containing protein n=1 Tax=Cnephaeus nilssonii TaxID=3371016 RepID=A0AA40I350_CNENI|nr:hypothetical protein QTO34_016869 [Eptesicus nilssonii]